MNSPLDTTNYPDPYSSMASDLPPVSVDPVLQHSDAGMAGPPSPFEMIPDPSFGAKEIATMLAPISMEVIMVGEEERVEVAFNNCKLTEVTWAVFGDSHDVRVDGVIVDGDPENKIVLPFPCTIHAVVATTDKGVISGDPFGDPPVISFYLTTDGASLPDRQHHVPPTKSSGTETGNNAGGDGSYHWVVAEIIKNEDDNPEWVPHNTSLVWEDYTHDWETVGTGVGIVKGTTQDAQTAQFRSIKGDDSGGGYTPVRITVEQDTEDQDTIVIKGDVDIPSGGETSLAGSDYIHVVDSNDPKDIFLANSNNANIRPNRGDTGFYVFYTADGGEVKKTAVYCTDPVYPTDVIGPSPELGKDTGGTT